MSTADDELVTDSEELTDHDPEMDHFLRQWREHRELTQPQLAERIGAQKSQISKWETKERPLTNVAWIRKICKALEINPDDLYKMPPSLMESSAEQSNVDHTADVAEHVHEGVVMLSNRIDLIEDLAALPDELVPTARQLLQRLKALGGAARANPTKRGKVR